MLNSALSLLGLEKKKKKNKSFLEVKRTLVFHGLKSNLGPQTPVTILLAEMRLFPTVANGILESFCGFLAFSVREPGE